MNAALIALAACPLILLITHFVAIAIAAPRCRARSGETFGPGSEGFSLIRPVCGIEPHLEWTLGTSFHLAHPRHELIFCVARADDPAVPLINKLIAQHPAVDARLLIGDERISANPKLNNLVKGVAAARHEWVVFADSNIVLPRDYLEQLQRRFDPQTALVCSPPSGALPGNFWAHVECAFLNSFQARFQYAADSAGFGFAQGKSMLFRRDWLQAAGGARALASELAEDAAATKLVRGLGYKVRLADGPFPQPLGVRSARQVWHRQARWGQLRRASFLSCFLPEILCGALPFLLLWLAFCTFSGITPLTAIPIMLAWYGAEIALVQIAGWPLTWQTPFAMVARDLMLPAIWFNAWRDTGFEWRGNKMNVDEASFAAIDS